MGKETKTKSVGARLSIEEYELLQKTGYNTYDIIKMFLDKYYSTTPVGLSIELDLLKLELDKLPDREVDIKNRINTIENKISKYNNLKLISESIISMIKIVISKYLHKSIKYHNISEFLEDNEELVSLHSNKTGYNTEDYKKLVIEYYDTHYN